MDRSIHHRKRPAYFNIVSNPFRAGHWIVAVMQTVLVFQFIRFKPLQSGALDRSGCALEDRRRGRSFKPLQSGALDRSNRARSYTKPAFLCFKPLQSGALDRSVCGPGSCSTLTSFKPLQSGALDRSREAHDPSRGVIASFKPLQSGALDRRPTAVEKNVGAAVAFQTPSERGIGS